MSHTFLLQILGKLLEVCVCEWIAYACNELNRAGKTKNFIQLAGLLLAFSDDSKVDDGYRSLWSSKDACLRGAILCCVLHVLPSRQIAEASQISSASCFTSFKESLSEYGLYFYFRAKIMQICIILYSFKRCCSSFSPSHPSTPVFFCSSPRPHILPKCAYRDGSQQTSWHFVWWDMSGKEQSMQRICLSISKGLCIFANPAPRLLR